MAVYIQGIGINNALGNNRESVFAQFNRNQGLGHKRVDPLISERAATVCRVVSELAEFPAGFERYSGRNNQMLYSAYLEIKPQVDAAIEKYGADRVAIILGTSTSGTGDGEAIRIEYQRATDMPDHYDFVKEETNGGAEFLQKLTGIKGICYTVSTACTSSGKSMISAKRYLDNNLYDAVIVGGADSLCGMTINGFDALESVDPNISVPFSKNRVGINLGEGGCLMLLSREKSDIQLLGVGESSDAHHMSAPDPEAVGAKLAMNQALDMAGLQGSDIAYINLHGTGTPKNDIMEAKAVYEVLGPDVPASSTKGLIGHTLGAASAQELGLCVLMLQSDINEQMIPPHLFDGEKDPELHDINLIAEPTPIRTPYMMSNSFAFGGSNASIIIGKVSG